MGGGLLRERGGGRVDRGGGRVDRASSRGNGGGRAFFLEEGGASSSHSILTSIVSRRGRAFGGSEGGFARAFSARGRGGGFGIGGGTASSHAASTSIVWRGGGLRDLGGLEVTRTG